CVKRGTHSLGHSRRQGAAESVLHRVRQPLRSSSAWPNYPMRSGAPDGSKEGLSARASLGSAKQEAKVSSCASQRAALCRGIAFFIDTIHPAGQTARNPSEDPSWRTRSILPVVARAFAWPNG